METKTMNMFLKKMKKCLYFYFKTKGTFWPTQYNAKGAIHEKNN